LIKFLQHDHGHRYPADNSVSHYVGQASFGQILHLID